MGGILFVMNGKDKALVDEYMRGGMSFEAACSMAGVDAGVIVEDVSDEYSDAQLIEMNGSLAVRAIHKALTSGKIDNTIMTAAVRAVQMLDEQRKASGGTSAEDDMLLWVAEHQRAQDDKRREELKNGE